MPRQSARWSNVDRLLGFGRNGHRRPHRFHEEEQALLSHIDGPLDSAISPKDVTKVCLRLRHLIQEVVPCEMDAALITAPHSRIITPGVVQAAKDAGGALHRGCVVYALLVNLSWFKQQALEEIWDSGLHNLRAEACGVVAKLIIEGEEDTSYLLHSVLLHRYSHLVRGVPDHASNVIEKAVDLHAVRVIGSSGYQKCIGYLWRGWVVQSEDDPSIFVDYTDKDNTKYFVHIDPNRMRTPRNQNAAQLLFSLIYLGLYTIAINTVNPTGVIDAGEILLYVFTLGFVCDEVLKVYKVGSKILGFWDVFNSILYSFLTVSLAFRLVGLSFGEPSAGREYYSVLSYNMLAFIAPMFWCRLLFYLDSFKFFGTMLVVLKVMLKESVIFFALLAFIIVGFLQAFVGLDLAEDNRSSDTSTVIQYMIKVVLSSPELDGFDNFGAPWGTILYYCYTFIVMTILLNILIALYNSAYSDVLENADDEYLALFAQRTIQFVRAPDENVYIAPLNLIEIVISASSEWWMRKKTYDFINDCVMTVLYSPLLAITAYFETRTAHAIRRNRARGEEDDDVVNEWEQLEHEVDLVAEGWTKTCDGVKPNLADDPVLSQVKLLRAELDGLKTVLADLADSFGVVTSQDTRIANESVTNETVVHDADETPAQTAPAEEEVGSREAVVQEPLVEVETVVQGPIAPETVVPEPSAPQPEPLERDAETEPVQQVQPEPASPTPDVYVPDTESPGPQVAPPELQSPEPQVAAEESKTPESPEPAPGTETAGSSQPVPETPETPTVQLFPKPDESPSEEPKTPETEESKPKKKKKKGKAKAKGRESPPQAGPSGRID